MKIVALLVMLLGLWLAATLIESHTPAALTAYVALALGTVALAAVDERQARR